MVLRSSGAAGCLYGATAWLASGAPQRLLCSPGAAWRLGSARAMRGQPFRVGKGPLPRANLRLVKLGRGLCSCSPS
jgi:hypothetical protein